MISQLEIKSAKQGEQKMHKTRITPLEDRIVVEQKSADEKTPGGIILPEKAKEKPTRGIVLFAGPGRMLDSGERAPMHVKVGDEIMYDKYAGTEIEVDSKKYVVIREVDTLAVLS